MIAMMKKLSDKLNFRILIHILLILTIFVLSFPLIYTFIVSTQSLSAAVAIPPNLKVGGGLIENYATAWGRANMGRVLLNSGIMSLSVTVGKITVAAMTAFAIVFFDPPGGRFIFFITLLTLMLPIPVRLLPTHEVVSSFGWIDTYFALTLPYFVSATATFLLRQFFKTVPQDLVDAARVDGASPTRFFFRVLLPLSRTNIAALFVILFIWTWNQYLWPLVVTNSENMRVMQLGISFLIPKGGTGMPPWNIIMAAVVIAVLPPLLVLMIMQREFVKGLIEPEK